jgi:hypothetical protein
VVGFGDPLDLKRQVQVVDLAAGEWLNGPIERCLMGRIWELELRDDPSNPVALVYEVLHQSRHVECSILLDVIAVGVGRTKIPVINLAVNLLNSVIDVAGAGVEVVGQKPKQTGPVVTINTHTVARHRV